MSTPYSPYLPADAGAGVGVAGSTLAEAAPADAIHTQFGENLRDVLRFLDAVAAVTPAQVRAGLFMSVWSQTGSPATLTEVREVLARVSAMSPQHFASVMASIESEKRQFLHVTAQALAKTVAADIPEMYATVQLLRQLLGRFMPATAQLPEDTDLDTTRVLQETGRAFDALSKLCRPDEENVRLRRAEEAAHTAYTRLAALGINPVQQPPSAERATADAQAALAHIQRTRGVAELAAVAGVADAVRAKDAEAAKHVKAKPSATVIALSVVSAVFIAAFVVLLVLYVRRRRTYSTAQAALASRGAAARTGGIARWGGDPTSVVGAGAGAGAGVAPLSALASFDNLRFGFDTMPP